MKVLARLALQSLLVFLGLYVGHGPAEDLAPSIPAGTTLATRAKEAITKLPLSFEINRGQADDSVKFLARGAGYGFFLTPTEAVLSFNRTSARTARRSGGSAETSQHPSGLIRMKLEGGDPATRISGVDETGTRSNYLMGDRPALSSISHFSRVKYEAVYPGIDLVWYGNQSQLEYDWIVAPGSNAKDIRLSFSGIDSLSIAGNGDLVFTTSGGEMRQQPPVIYQNGDHGRQLVNGGYVITGQNEIGFEIAGYDKSKPLVIDPYLYYSTYFGGTGYSAEYSTLALDSAGNVYVAGITASTNFPVINAGQSSFGGYGVDGIGDGFVLKINPAGTAAVYATYIGGSRDDEIFGLALAPDGTILLAGDTSSLNFPLKNPLQSTFSLPTSDTYHAWLAKLTADGTSLVYSTFLGGNGYEDSISSLASDANGNAYFVGYANSTNFPRVNPLYQNFQGGTYDAVVGEVNATGSAIVFCTYFGGSGDDIGEDIRIDETGFYIQGLTQSTNLPLKNPFQSTFGGTGVDSLGDGFVTKFSLDGSSIIYSTYLGGSGDDEIFGMALNADHSLYLAGDTSSANMPMKNAYQTSFATQHTDSYHGFITRLNADGSLGYGTYFGGTNDDAIVDITSDAAGAIYIIGETSSTDIPLMNPLQSTYQGGDFDAFVAKFNPSGSVLLFSTYLGGSNLDEGANIHVDSVGNIFGAGLTYSANLPTRNPIQSSNNGTTNLFIFKLGADEVTVGAADFNLTTIAGNGIVSAFGPALANATAPAPGIPLPTVLAGTTVKVTDSLGVERLAPLFFASPNQVNYQVPAGSASGPAFILITSGDGTMSSGVMQIKDSSPAIFTLNQSGSGSAAALDAITYAGAPFNAKRASGEQNIIAFFGTGFGQDATDIDADVSASVQVTIDGAPGTLLYAGRSPGYVGLNQMNVLLPSGIATGTHSIVFSRNGSASNSTTFDMK